MIGLLVTVVLAQVDGEVSFVPPEVEALSRAPRPPGPSFDVNAPYPTDPHAAEYERPRARPVGVASGQLRMFALAGVSHELDVEGQFTTESMHLTVFAVRGTIAGEVDTTLRPAHPHLLSARLGLALHLLPYRRVDVSGFIDAGLVVADTFVATRRAAPVIVAGGAVEVAITSHLFLRLEGQFLWSVLPMSGPVIRFSGLSGVGWVL